ncbi:hypothetical protein B2J93_2459 [Marssonina coronariae]|uniref:Uncharacterized protein n=1 Tax=Diplocarpon coronariae TaxID=2795749 RepID=A0A218YRX4_9HELO|nr:hypothetical protein B2J93_2459 [Marssonina coronariae]
MEPLANTSCQATLTDPFLDFTASRGNNLRAIGLTAGCKWCLCAARWKEAVEYASSSAEKDGDLAKGSVVPKVHLHATSVRALDVVGLADLKKYAAEPEGANARNVAHGHGGMGGAVRELKDMSGRGSLTTRDQKGAHGDRVALLAKSGRRQVSRSLVVLTSRASNDPRAATLPAWASQDSSVASRLRADARHHPALELRDTAASLPDRRRWTLFCGSSCASREGWNAVGRQRRNARTRSFANRLPARDEVLPASAALVVRKVDRVGSRVWSRLGAGRDYGALYGEPERPRLHLGGAEIQAVA